ncbi:HPr(Ser) kinase/phosphatase [candidate division KSB1 bacterium]|nr:MAG: HPr(Ser) kinase/phosphatase [candidate division KSB1 bacterium]
MKKVKVSTFFRENREKLNLELLSTKEGFKKEIKDKDLHRPGLAFTGFFNIFPFKKIQILGNCEITYLKNLTEPEIKRVLSEFFNYNIPCIIITDNNKPPDILISIAKQKGVSVFRTSLPTNIIFHDLLDYLEDKFSPEITIHASLVDVYGVGLLFTGRSGIGKSEITLDLIERGHRLVSDDMVTIKKKGKDILIGSGSEFMKHFIEIRGLGIIDVMKVFGIRGIRLQKRIEVEVLLEDVKDITSYDRTGLDKKYTEYLGVKIPLIRLPIFPGKNITVISEVIALNQLLKTYGYDSAKEFDDKLIKALYKKSKLKEFIKGAIE